MTKPLHFWSLTVGETWKPLPIPERMDECLDEFFKGWCYQGELGTKLGHKHYQCRGILGEAQRKATLLTIFEARGFDRRDITFLPESNKSIQQGGLAFYVMDDEKARFLPMRADSTFQIARKKDWIPNMCKHIVDSPRPWMTSVLDILTQKPSHRSIIWICTLGGFGGVGKSLFVSYLEAKRLACWIGDGTPTQIKEAVIQSGERQAYLVDMPKTFAHDNRMCDYINAIETVKNGFIKTAMHGKPKVLLMDNRPHMFCFCNQHPPYAQMTDGRFDVKTINPHLAPDLQTLDSYVSDAQVSPGV